MKVHVIDGTYELFRAHYGKANIGGIHGLLRSMASLLRQVEVTHVAFAFDTTIECFRNKMFDGYKTAAGLPDEVLTLFPDAERLAKAMGMVVWSMVEYEADDALATAAKLYVQDERVEEVLICTRDKDLHWCLHDPKVRLYDRMFDQYVTREETIKKYRVPPESIPDYLALVGDKADGIPGIPQWGHKSASIVLSHYETIEKIPAYSTAWPMKVRGAEKLATTLRENRTEASLYKALATLHTEVPITESVDDLEWKGETEDLYDMCEEHSMTYPKLPTHADQLFMG